MAMILARTWDHSTRRSDVWRRLPGVLALADRSPCVGDVQGLDLLESDEKRHCSGESMRPSGSPDLVLYGVVGLKQGWGGTMGSIGSVGTGRQKRAVLISESVTFDGPDGGTVTITSRHPSDDEQFEQVCEWAPMNPYLASPRGLAARAAWDRSTPIPRPGDVNWLPVTILVVGQDSPFQMCGLGDGYWAAVGRVPDATVIIDGRNVPISDVRLERLASRNPLPYLAPTSANKPQRSCRDWMTASPECPSAESRVGPTTGRFATSRSTK